MHYKKLKNNKSPGCDNLPSELIKEWKESMSPDLCDLFSPYHKIVIFKNHVQ